MFRSLSKNRIIKNSLIFFLLVLFIIFGFLEYKVISSQNLYTPTKSDVIIVLGHSIDEKGEPEKWLENRLVSAKELYDLGFASKIIVSGGKGDFDIVPVSYSMKKWLDKNGVKSEDIIMETNSKDTYENIIFSKKIMDKYKFSSAIIVTNDFHIFRSMYIAKEYIGEVYGQSAHVDLDVRKFFAYIKEPLSILKYKLLR